MSTHNVIPTFQMSRSDVEKYSDWTECAAFRVVEVEPDIYALQVTNDLELITRPEGDRVAP